MKILRSKLVVELVDKVSDPQIVDKLFSFSDHVLSEIEWTPEIDKLSREDTDKWLMNPDIHTIISDTRTKVYYSIYDALSNIRENLVEEDTL